MNDLKGRITNGAYWGIATKISKFELKEDGYPPPIIKDSNTKQIISKMRTRLNHFTNEEERLINWGYVLTDTAMRHYVLEKNAMPGRLPYPERPM